MIADGSTRWKIADSLKAVMIMMVFSFDKDEN